MGVTLGKQQERICYSSQDCSGSGRWKWEDKKEWMTVHVQEVRLWIIGSHMEDVGYASIRGVPLNPVEVNPYYAHDSGWQWALCTIYSFEIQILLQRYRMIKGIYTIWNIWSGLQSVHDHGQSNPDAFGMEHIYYQYPWWATISIATVVICTGDIKPGAPFCRFLQRCAFLC